MEPIEQRLRASLIERADDVEVTPHLWQEVDRRRERRQWRTVGSWVTVSAAAMVAAVLVVPALLPADTGVEVAERPTVPGGTDDPAVPGTPDDPAVVGTTGIGPLLLGAGRELRILEADATTRWSYEFPETGGSTVVGLAVRPGAQPDELTAAVLTTAEGMYDLRILRGDGAQHSLEAVDDGTYRPGQGAGADLTISGPLWAPDGTSLTWLEEDEDGVRLRTIGWSDGPGTGVAATDNATFLLPAGTPSSLELREWLQLAPDRFLLRATTQTPDDGWYELEVTRQADGAWSLAAGAAMEPITAPPIGDGPVRALAGMVETQDGAQVQPAWLVRQGVAGPVVIHQVPTGEPRIVVLPPDLLGPADDASSVWAVAVEEGVVISSSRTEMAVLVDEAGDVHRLPGRAAFVSLIG